MTREDFEQIIQEKKIVKVSNHGVVTKYSPISDAKSFDHLPKASYGCIQIAADRWQNYFTDQNGDIHFYRDIREEEEALDLLLTFLLYLKDIDSKQ